MHCTMHPVSALREVAESMARASQVAMRLNAFIEIGVATERLHSMIPRPINLSNAVTAVKQLFRDTAPTHGRTKAAYDQYSERRDRAEISNRKDAIMLAQLCSGHSNLLRVYRHVIDQ